MTATRITSEVRLVSEVLYSGRFEVPWHQRYYDWKVEQVHELQADLKDALERPNPPPSQPSLDKRGELTQHTDLQLVLPDPHEPYDGGASVGKVPVETSVEQGREDTEAGGIVDSGRGKHRGRMHG